MVPVMKDTANIPAGEQHPDFERLLQLVEKALPPAEAEEVGRHVAGCGACAESMERIERTVCVLGAGPWLQPSRSTFEAAVRAFRSAWQSQRAPVSFVARLAWDGYALGLAPGLRSGASDAHQLLYTTEAADLDLNVTETPAGTRSVIGQALPKGESAPLQAADVLLIRADRVVAHTSTTHTGEFIFEDIPAGDYTLVVLTPDLRLEVSEVPL